MNHIERRNAELPYIADQTVMEELEGCRKILQRLNTADRSDGELIKKIVKELLGKSENAVINPSGRLLCRPFLLLKFHETERNYPL